MVALLPLVCGGVSLWQPCDRRQDPPVGGRAVEIPPFTTSLSNKNSPRGRSCVAAPIVGSHAVEHFPFGAYKYPSLAQLSLVLSFSPSPSHTTYSYKSPQAWHPPRLLRKLTCAIPWHIIHANAEVCRDLSTLPASSSLHVRIAHSSMLPERRIPSTQGPRSQPLGSEHGSLSPMKSRRQLRLLSEKDTAISTLRFVNLVGIFLLTELIGF
jgi:hypothetical protein